MMNKKNFAPTLYPLNKDITKKWFVKYYPQPGKPVKLCGCMNSLHTVEERIKESKRIIKAITDPSQIVIKQREDLLYHLSGYLEHKRPGLEKKSYQTYFSYLKQFAKWYRPAQKLEKDICPGEYIRHMQIEQYQNNYIRRIKIFLQAAFTKLVKDGKYPNNPFVDIKIKKLKSKSKLPFHANQVQALKCAILNTDPQLWMAIQFEYYLFFRPKELRLLKISNILFDEMQIEAGSDILKDDDVLRKAIPMQLMPVIEQLKCFPSNWYLFSVGGYPGPVMLGMNNLNNRHRCFLKRLNISNRYSFYSWVHTGIRDSVMAGVPHKQLQLQKGHSDLKMFDEYLKNIGVGDCTQLINNFPTL